MFLHAAALLLVALSGRTVLQSPVRQRTALVLAATAEAPREVSPSPPPIRRKPIAAPRVLRVPRPAQPVLLPAAPAIEPVLRKLPEPVIRTPEFAPAPPSAKSRPEPLIRTGNFEQPAVVERTRIAGSTPVSPASDFAPAAPAVSRVPLRAANIGVFGVPAAEPSAGQNARLRVPVGNAFGSTDASAAAPARSRPAGRTDAFSGQVAERTSLIASRTVHAGEFGDSAGAPPRAEPRPATAHAGGFGEVVASLPARTAQQGRNDATSGTTPVEILEKPHPAYTEEVRRLLVEGNVLVEVLFAASGEVQVGRVVRALGHGLDECAVAAARAIKFRPAVKDGKPVDTTATVRIVFQLAF